MNPDQVRARLEKFRNKLFDFGLKNPLLNYQHPQKKAVRFVDGLTDLIYSKLREGNGRLVIHPYTKKWSEDDFNLKPTGFINSLARSAEYRPHLLSPVQPDKPDQLEKTLANLAKTAKSLMAESGVNTLYLVFGFLEWRDKKGPDTPRPAPLLMAPVELRREKLDGKTGSAIYSIEFSEEGAVVNPALREFLQRDYENPAILRSPFIQHLVGGGRGVEPLQLSGASIGHPAIDHDPPLVFDADSSQHAALLDALRGRNLVIEGPPGTGKSQTISNLIAAALAGGKKVLFVAEKEAALEVVHNRLERCGLSPFCLELHSHKTQTGALSESLKRRLELKAPAPESGVSPDRKSSLNHNKDRLSVYAEIINRPHGKCGRTVHQSTWRREQLRQSFTFNASLIEPILLPDAASLSYEQVEGLKQSAEIYGQHLSQVVKDGRLTEHPWYGVTNWHIDAATEREIVLSLQAIENVSNQIQKQIDGLNRECAQKLLDGEASLRKVLARDALPVVPLNLIAELLPSLRHPDNREKLRGICQWINEYRQFREQAEQCFSQKPDWGSPGLTTLRNFCMELRDMEIDWMSLRELKDYINQLEGRASDLSRISTWFHQICSILKCPLPFTAHTSMLAVRTANILGEIPWQAIPLRAPELEADGLVHIVSQAFDEAEKLHRQERNIAERLDLSLRPTREQLVEYLDGLADASLLSFTRNEFRSARQAWRRMDRGGKKASYREMKELFRELIHLTDRQNEFTSNAQYRKALGNLFDGLQTPLDQLLTLSIWYLAVKRKLGFASDAGQQIMSSLFNIPVINLQALYEFFITDQVNQEEVRAIFEDYDSFAASLPAHLRQAACGNLDSFTKQLRELVAELSQIVRFLEECHVKPETAICEIPDLFESLQRMFLLHGQIINNREAAQLLGVESISTEMDMQSISATLDFVEGLERSPLPAAIISWLMTPDIGRRAASLRGSLAAIEANYTRFLQSKDAFARLTQINDVEGFFYDVGVSSQTFGQVAAKAKMAILATAELSTWLSYLRARQGVIELGLEPLVLLAEAGDVPAAEMLSAAEYVYQNALVFDAFKAHPLLSRFDGLTHNRIRESFARLDDQIIRSTAGEIALELLKAEAPPGRRDSMASEAETASERQTRVANYTDMVLVRHIINRPKTRLKIRQIVANAHEALLALKPCFMMSPLSIAQYLPVE